MKSKKPVQIKEHKKEGEVKKVARKILGITANVRNLLIAIALLFAFLSGFFQVLNWADTTYARLSYVKMIKAKQDFSWENDILKGMYSRYYLLDNLVNLSPDPTKVPENLRKEFTSLGKEITLQEDKVKLLQKETCLPK
jgi:hypothetical protein